MRQHFYFAVLLLIGAVIYLAPTRALARLALENETYSHIAVIPAVSLLMMAARRRVIFANPKPALLLGLALCAGGLGLYVAGIYFGDKPNIAAYRNQEFDNDYLTFCMAGAVTWTIGGFVAAYGRQVFKRARFALLFLIFAVPLPTVLLEAIIKALQSGSAAVVEVILTILGVPFYRSGMVFELTNVAVRVAEQCSGIRSSMAMFILSVIVGYMFLHSVRNSAILVISIFPITVLKNALRITTVTLLANYVDLKFLTHHWIHSSGGILFFIVALGIFMPVVWLLRKCEKRTIELVETEA